jgi:hypothetical protein
MKKTLIFMVAFMGFLNANCQNDKNLLNYFPVIPNDSIVNTILLENYMTDEKTIPDSISLKYFFNGKIEAMQDVFVGYNMDDNTYTETPYTIKVYPLYRQKHNDVYLLCYCIQSVVYLDLYDSVKDKKEATFIIADFSDDFGNMATFSVVFPNSYIATTSLVVNPNDFKIYYILSKIDYEKLKLIEIKKITETEYKGYNEVFNSYFYVLGISRKGELLDDNN